MKKITKFIRISPVILCIAMSPPASAYGPFIRFVSDWLDNAMQRFKKSNYDDSDPFDESRPHFNNPRLLQEYIKCKEKEDTAKKSGLGFNADSEYDPVFDDDSERRSYSACESSLQ